MKAVSGIVYLRNKLEKELEEKSSKLNKVQTQIPIAVQEGDDEVTLVLIEQKNTLTADIERIKVDVKKMIVQAEDSKENLLKFQSEIQKLKAEKQEMLARRENALAQKRIHDEISNISLDDDIKALGNVRESINKLEAQVDVASELNNSTLDTKLKNIESKTMKSSAKDELEELKKQINIQKGSINIEKKL